jgi:multidrug efflux pump subunit AcrA (membrane-fusion protein)
MTAVTTISDDSVSPDWLVPTDALQEFEGETTVRVVRNGQPTRVSVLPGTSQGEWTVVQSSELKAGDEVVGEVSSFLDEDGSGSFRGGPFGGRPRN